MNKKVYQILFLVLMFAMSISLLTYFYPTEKQFDYSYTIGTPWLYDDLVAPYEFPIYRTDAEIQAEKDSIAESFIPFITDLSNEEASVNRYMSLSSKIIDEKISHIKADEVKNEIKSKLSEIYSDGVIKSLAGLEGKLEIKIINKDGISEFNLIDNIYTSESAKKTILNEYFLNHELYMADSLAGFLLRNYFENTEIAPNLKFDVELNEKFISQKQASVSPTIGKIHKNDPIISKHEIINSSTARILDSMQQEFRMDESVSSLWKIRLGMAIIFVVLYLVIFTYMYIFSQKTLYGYRMNLFFVLQMLLLFVMVFLIFKFTNLSINIVPFILVPLMLLTFYEFKVSFIIYFITILIAAFFAPNRFEFVFIQTIAGLVTMFSFKNTSKRQQIFFSMLVAFVTYAVLYTGFSLTRMSTFSQDVVMEYVDYAISSVLLLLYLPLLFIYEKVFGFVSGFTLMELCDTNNPALRALSEKAQGTFQHSVQLSNIVESLVRDLGGNYLLARTGAMYHDIGKMYAPEYFIENQSGVNVHDNLPFEESAKKIIAHVDEGLTLAKKYKLPRQLEDFIRQHHGTSMTRYFYNSWLNAHPGETPNVADFQYAGPKPKSIELVAMMMADAVEAASRTLKVYSHESIEKLVSGIVDAQFKDGQYDEVEITMKQISRAKLILISKIENIYHARIEYPELNNKTEEK